MKPTGQEGGMIHTQAYVTFYNGTKLNPIETQKAGRPIYDDVEMIKIAWQGNTKSELHAPAKDRCDRVIINPEDRSRSYPAWKDHPDFKPTYDAWKAGQAIAVSGTPISELTFLTEARREELRAVKIFTVEAIANMDPATLARLGGMSDIKRQAQAFLDRAAGASVDAKYAQERDAMAAEMAAMRQQMEMLLNGQAQAPAPAPVVKATKAIKNKADDGKVSMFEAWDDADIVNWMADADPAAPKPHHKTGHAKLVEMADEMNARITAMPVPAAA